MASNPGLQYIQHIDCQRGIGFFSKQPNIIDYRRPQLPLDLNDGKKLGWCNGQWFLSYCHFCWCTGFSTSNHDHRMNDFGLIIDIDGYSINISMVKYISKFTKIAWFSIFPHVSRHLELRDFCLINYGEILTYLHRRKENIFG